MKAGGLSEQRYGEGRLAEMGAGSKGKVWGMYGFSEGVDRVPPIVNWVTPRKKFG
jgi:hypothetical protein